MMIAECESKASNYVTDRERNEWKTNLHRANAPFSERDFLSKQWHGFAPVIRSDDLEFHDHQSSNVIEQSYHRIF